MWCSTIDRKEELDDEWRVMGCVCFLCVSSFLSD